MWCSTEPGPRCAPVPYGTVPVRGELVSGVGPVRGADDGHSVQSGTSSLAGERHQQRGLRQHSTRPRQLGRQNFH